MYLFIVVYLIHTSDHNNNTEEMLTNSTSWTLQKPLDASEYNFEVDIYLDRYLESEYDGLSYGGIDNFTRLNFELEGNNLR